MKVALITDTHFGVRNGSALFHNYFDNFYSSFFFPYLKERKDIKHIIHLGDMFDVRKHIDYSTLNYCKQYFFDPLKKLDLKVLAIVGNHDIYYKDSLKLNSQSLLLREYGEHIKVIDSAQEAFNGKALLVPWITSENYDDCLEKIKFSDASFVFGHFEINGFAMYRDMVPEEQYGAHRGMSPALFSSFVHAFSGHYHHRSTKGNVTYLGCPYEMNFADCNDPKGFHILDLKTGELEFIENKNRLFVKVFYNDTVKGGIDKNEDYNNKFVKVVVEKKTNAYTFETLIDYINKQNPYELKIVENLNDIMEASIDNLHEDVKLEDTLTILKHYIDENNRIDVDKEKLFSFMRGLYIRAQLT